MSDRDGQAGSEIVVADRRGRRMGVEVWRYGGEGREGEEILRKIATDYSALRYHVVLLTASCR